ncbi:MAG: hypothetical protein AAFQ80_06210 [Cyanobacteria bacterium J06621_8]
MTKFQSSPKHNVPQWQSNKMKQMIIDRWQEVSTIVEARNRGRSNQGEQK